MSAPASELLDNPDYVSDLKNDDLSSRQIADRWGTGKSTVNDHRKNLGTSRPQNENSPTSDSETHRPDGSADYVLSSDRAWGFKDFREFIRSKGQDPDQVTFTWGVTTNPTGGFWNKLNNVKPIPSSDKVLQDLSDIRDIIEDYTPRKAVYADLSDFSKVNGLSDLQLGKTDDLGGTETTVTHVLRALDCELEDIDRRKPKQAVIVDAGDLIENFYNTSSQRQTNDMPLTEQIRTARVLLARYIKEVAQICPNVAFITVPSNHSMVRVDKKSPASHPNDDHGIDINHALEEAFAASGRFPFVQFIRPATQWDESVGFETADGTKLGVVHGHQFSSPEKAAQWWQGQDHGRQATSDADILLHGHYHTTGLRQSGNARWIINLPSSDVGSAWFRNLTGETSKRGVLTFDVSHGMWANLDIR